MSSKAVYDKFNKIALGSTDEEKRSAMYQSNNSCPKQRETYYACTDYFHAIDITTRLTSPIRHSVTCQEPFVNLRQCIAEHMKNWHEARREVYELEEAAKTTQKK